MTKFVLVALLMSLMAVTVELSIEQQAQANILHDLGDAADNYKHGKSEMQEPEVKVIFVHQAVMHIVLVGIWGM